MTDLDPLSKELDSWAANGEVATLWWRDDDAEAPTDEIRRMLDLSNDSGVTVVVAAVPAKAVDELAAPLLACPTAAVVQHGYAHRDHSPADVKGKWELGPHRPLEVILEELDTGRTRLRSLFGERLRPVMVPPWNRIDDGLLPALSDTGYETLSTFGPRPELEAAPGLRQVNCHCDIIGWKRGRSFIGAGKTAERLVEHLRARRLGEVDPDEPTGLLTHVWIHDEQAWTVLAEVLALVSGHPGGCWLDRSGLGL